MSEKAGEAQALNSSVCAVFWGLVSAASLSCNSISQTVRPAIALAGLQINPVWGEQSASGAWQKCLSFPHEDLHLFLGSVGDGSSFLPAFIATVKIDDSRRQSNTQLQLQMSLWRSGTLSSEVQLNCTCTCKQFHKAANECPRPSEMELTRERTKCQGARKS